jgi:cytochrome oxidase Cu insertion factor (SCO1/SenC/PrrC family)
MGLTTLAGDPAPAFSLTDQEGARVSLAGMHGDAVVLTFLDSAGPDLSSVETREIVQADRDLAGLSSHVLFVAINCDASAGSRAALVAFDRREGLTGIPNWRFLTAPAAQLRAVWSAYGITVSVDPHAPIVLHTEEILFISPTGAERFSVAPYGNQGPDGTYSLPQADIARWASGIADYASEMLH